MTPIQDALASKIEDIIYAADEGQSPYQTASDVLRALLGDERLFEAVCEFRQSPHKHY